MRFAQIELAFNPATRLVLQLTSAVKIVDQGPLGCNQQSLDFVMMFDELPMGAAAAMLELLETIAVVRTERLDNLCWQVTLCGEFA